MFTFFFLPSCGAAEQDLIHVLFRFLFIFPVRKNKSFLVELKKKMSILGNLNVVPFSIYNR